VIAFAMTAMVFASTAYAHNCTCRANGISYKQGQILCIRGQLARCDMNLNNSSWKIIAPTCPEARLAMAEPRNAAMMSDRLHKH